MEANRKELIAALTEEIQLLNEARNKVCEAFEKVRKSHFTLKESVIPSLDKAISQASQERQKWIENVSIPDFFNCKYSRNK